MIKQFFPFIILIIIIYWTNYGRNQFAIDLELSTFRWMILNERLLMKQ